MHNSAVLFDDIVYGVCENPQNKKAEEAILQQKI